MRAVGQHRVDLAEVDVSRCCDTVAEQRVDVYAERVRDIDDGGQAQLGRAALNVRNIGRLLIGQLRQRLLRQPQLLPVPPDTDPDCRVIKFQFSFPPENFFDNVIVYPIRIW